MEKKGDWLKNKKIVKYIIIAYLFVFMLSFSWHLSKFFFDIMILFSAAGIILIFLSLPVGLLLYPISSFLHSLLPAQLGFIPVHLSTVYDLAALAGLIIFSLFYKKKKRSGYNLNDYLAFGFLMLLGLYSVYHGVDISFSNYWLVLSAFSVLIYFVVSDIIDSKERLRAFLWIMVIAVMSLIFRFSFYARGFQESFIGGSFDNNMFSRDLVFIIPIVIYMFWSEKNNLLKGILLISLAFLMQNLMVMGSRASWLALAPFLLLIGIKNIKKKSTWGLGILAVIFLVFYVLSSPQIIDELYSIEYAEQGTESEEGSMRGRFEALEAGLSLFYERPILGWGPSRHEELNMIRMEELGYKGRATHNSYLDLMIGMGFFGILIYVMIFVYSCINAYKAQKLTKRKDNFVYNMSWAVIFGLGALFINQTMINRPYASVIWISFGLSTSLYIIAKKQSKEKDNNEKNINPPEKDISDKEDKKIRR